MSVPNFSARSAWLALILIAPAASAGVAANIFFQGSSLGLGLWAAAKLWLFGLPAVWHLCVDRQPWRRPRLKGGPSPVKGYRYAVLSGLAASAVLAGAYFSVGNQMIDRAVIREALRPMGLLDASTYLLASAYWILINSVLEEYVYRWFIVGRCNAVMAALPAVLVSASLFVVHHILAMGQYFSWQLTTLGAVAIFVAGAVWSWLYQRFENIWVPYLSHAIVDMTVFTIGYDLLFGL